MFVAFIGKLKNKVGLIYWVHIINAKYRNRLVFAQNYN